MKVLAISNQKGGCGKTITAMNLAGALVEMGERVLLIDLDPQAHATLGMGIAQDGSSLTSYEIFKAFIECRRLDVKELQVKVKEGLYIIPSSMSLSTAEQELSGSEGAISALSNFISDNRTKEFVQIPAASIDNPTVIDYLNELDYIIIDCPPSIGFLTFNALYAADEVIVPVDMSSFSMQGTKNIEKMVDLLEERKGKRPEVSYLLTLFDKRSNFARSFYERMQEKFGDKLYSTPIRTNIKIREAASRGKTVFEVDPLSNGAKDYWQMALEVTGASPKSDVKFKELALKAPDAQKVYVVGDFNDWELSDAALLQMEDGHWKTKLRLNKGQYRYKFVIDDQWVHDESNPMAEDDSYGGKNSILHVE